jgi:hypothetical protein
MRTTAMILAAATLGCGVRQLQPMSPPPRSIPELPPEVPPPEPGTTPVAMDADIPSRVFDEFGRDICLTPCIVNLNPGVRDLVFKPIDHFSERVGHPSITVGSRPLVYRYALGRHERHPYLNGAGYAAVITGMTAGVTLLPLALMSNTRDVGVDLELASSAAVVAGIAMLIAGRDTVQMGTGTVWSP